MATIVQGDIFDAKVEALVNPVNCVGVAGAGLALQFKNMFPANYIIYERACNMHVVRIGSMHIVHFKTIGYPKYIINFPTKGHWKEKSKLEDIVAGLEALVLDVKELRINTIAIPPLGCGLGGLDWDVVKPLIEEAFDAARPGSVLLYEPITQ